MDANHRVVHSVAVAYNEDSKLEAHAKHDKSILILRMVGVKESHGVLIQKHGLCLFKGNAMFSDVLPVLGVIPFKAQPIHTYNVCNIIGKVNTLLGLTGFCGEGICP